MLHGYTTITQGKSCSSKGGLVIYIDNKYKAEPIMNLNIYEHWEGLIIKVNGGNLSKSLTIGNIYRPPRTNNEQINSFINEFSSAVVSLENSNRELIIAGDFNINLLKINENETYSNFFDTLTSHSLYPQITLPTRFTRTNGTLIDNFFCKLGKAVLESWKTINDFLSKTKTQNKFPTFFKENDDKITDKKDITNKFNIFFTNIAQTITNDIKYDGNKNYSYYLNKYIHTVFKFQNIDEETVKKTIQSSYKK